MILGLAVAALWGTGDLLAALAARRFGTFRTLAIAQVTELGLCVAAWIALGSSFTVSAVSIEILLLAGAVTAAAYGALYRGLMLGPVMLVAPIASAYAVGPTILAVALLGERLPPDAATGAAIAIGGVIVVTAAHGRADQPLAARGRNGIPYGLAAMVGFALSAFMIAAFAQPLGWLLPLLISRVGAALTLAVVASGYGWSAIGRKQAYERRPSLLAVLAGLSNVAGTALYAHAGELGLVAVVTAVSAMFPLIPILGGSFLFHERVGRIEMCGIGAIIVGMALLA